MIKLIQHIHSIQRKTQSLDISLSKRIAFNAHFFSNCPHTHTHTHTYVHKAWNACVCVKPKYFYIYRNFFHISMLKIFPIEFNLVQLLEVVLFNGTLAMNMCVSWKKKNQKEKKKDASNKQSVHIKYCARTIHWVNVWN